MKEDVLEYLNKEPRFRERKSKWRGIADLLIKRYNLTIDRRILADIVADASSADRYWRDILKNDPSLRGSDYTDKDTLEQETMLHLNYSPGYEKDIKQLSLIK